MNRTLKITKGHALKDNAKNNFMLGIHEGKYNTTVYYGVFKTEEAREKKLQQLKKSFGENVNYI